MLKKGTKAANAAAVISGVGLAGYLCVYPFFVTSRYFYMTRAKLIFFCGFTALFAIACLILRKCVKKTTPIRLIRKNRTELYLGVFMALAVVSCLCSLDPLSSFSGVNGRYMGLMVFLMIWLAYVFVSRFCRMTKTVSVIFGVSVIAMCLIAFLQFVGFDPFGLYKGTKDTVRASFMALLGNKDVYYSYLSLTVPFALYLSFEAQELAEKLFWHVVVFFGFSSVVACNCEGAYIGIAISAVYFFFAKGKDKEGLLVFLRNALLFFAAALLVALTKSVAAQYGGRDGIVMTKLITPLFCGAGLAALAVLYVSAVKLPLSDKLIRALRKAALCLLAAGAGGCLGAFIYFTFINKTADIGSLSVIFRFDNGSWGNGRGYIWNRMVMIYKELPWCRKLFGAGEETVDALMKLYYPKEVAARNSNYDSAHNEFLQYLVTHGLLGFAAYVLFVVSALKSGFRKGGKYQRAAAIAAVCYLAQSTVNITQVLTTPLFFVFIALTQTSESAPPLPPPAAEDAATEDVAAEGDTAMAEDAVEEETAEQDAVEEDAIEEDAAQTAAAGEDVPAAAPSVS